jgi:hypothetical protein
MNGSGQGCLAYDSERGGEESWKHPGSADGDEPRGGADRRPDEGEEHAAAGDIAGVEHDPGADRNAGKKRNRSSGSAH